MGKIALSQHLSLDGVMQSPGPTDIPFKYRGWIMDFDRGPEGDRFQLEQAQNAEVLLLGRVTHEAMQAFWPTAEGEFADRLNELPKYVVSSTLTDSPWNATVLGDDWAQEVARLRTELDRRLWQPPPLAGAYRDGAGGRAAPHGLPGSARCGRSPVRGHARQDPDAPSRIASVRGRRGEHDLCTCNRGRVMRTSRINSREGMILPARADRFELDHRPERRRRRWAR
jgi:dihydrofolate reductase